MLKYPISFFKKHHSFLFSFLIIINPNKSVKTWDPEMSCALYFCGYGLTLLAYASLSDETSPSAPLLALCSCRYRCPPFSLLDSEGPLERLFSFLCCCFSCFASWGKKKQGRLGSENHIYPTVLFTCASHVRTNRSNMLHK